MTAFPSAANLIQHERREEISHANDLLLSQSTS
ncbi:hypothetical protein RB213_015914, partial [Colletotrichum asianum]